jgi:internalin A
MMTREVQKRIAKTLAKKSIELNLSGYFLSQIPELLGLEQLEVLYLSENEITRIENLGNLPNLQELSLFDNAIMRIENLDNLPNLQELVLSRNGLTEIENLDNLPNLQKLDISHNGLTEIENLDNLPNLQKLDLHLNQLTKIDNLDKLPNLQTLNLSENQLTQIENLDKLLNLQQLDLSYNQISDLSPLLPFLQREKDPLQIVVMDPSYTNTGDINVASNPITVPPIEIIKQGREAVLHWLEAYAANDNLSITPKARERIAQARAEKSKHLDLSNCKLTQIPELLGLEQLEVLYLTGNQLTRIENLDKLPNLRGLHLSSNKLTRIENLDKLPKLRLLDLDSNQFTRIENLDKLPNLQTLWLHSNQLTRIENLDKLPNLQELYLTNNELTRIENLDKLPNLQTLSLSFNELTRIENLDKLPNLRELQLNNNQLTRIESLDKLPSLQTLVFSTNPIADFSPLLPFLQKGMAWHYAKDVDERLNITYGDRKQGIILGNNPIANPPIYVAEQEADAVLRYWEMKVNGAKEVNLYEAKIVLVGEGGMGKTTLRCKLNDWKAKMPTKNDRTRGIDVTPHPFAHNGNNYIGYVWDFGGQDIYYSLHRFFLSDEAVYIVVTQSRNNEHKFDYWLPNIRLFAGKDNPILLFCNLHKGFKNSAISIDEYKKAFNIAAGLFEVDLSKLKDDNALRAFKDTLYHYISQLPAISKPIFETWLMVRRHLSGIASKHFEITYATFKDICAEYEVKGGDVDILGRLLHNLGIVLWYHDKPLLKDMLVLQPTWVTGAMYKLIDDKRISNNNGHFSQSDIDRLWKKEAYAQRKDALLALAAQFKLCYERRDQAQHYIIPARLSKDQPDIAANWDDKVGISIEYQYEFMPHGLVNQITAQLHQHIQDDKHAWNKGVVLHHERFQAQVCIKEDAFRRKISLSVAPSYDAKKLMAVVMEEMDNIHKTFVGIVYDIIIPCPCDNCRAPNKADPTTFKYQKLLDWVREDRNKIVTCNEGKQTQFKAIDLLEGIGKNVGRSEIGKDWFDDRKGQNPTSEPLKIFISYAQEDRKHLQTLKDHISPLIRKGMTVWYDQEILAGADWNREIEQHLQAADVVLLLISAYFLADRKKYIWDKEIPIIMQKHKQGQLIIPIVVRDCNWGWEEQLAKIQAVNAAIPLNSVADKDTAFANAARQIKEAINHHHRPK